MSQLINPQALKGFRDSLPGMEIPKKELISRLEKIFESFGFVPIDTPALEYTEVLLGKGGGETEKQIYRFKDHGDRDVSLRFDLTVPFARFMALHRSELPVPFKRYHINKVWRGENTQKGRYREFTQCDFDTVGVDCPEADWEIMQVMATSLEALEIGEFTIRLSHRGIFNRFLTLHEVQDQSVEILRTVDKLAKIGKEEVTRILTEIVGDHLPSKILDFITAKGSYLEVLALMERAAGGEAEDTQRLKALWKFIEAAGWQHRFVLDPSITRGLDYYTGVVYETFLKDLPTIGSVCSGGRYNDLASLYTKEKLPGVGSSVGLDRLLAALEELGRIKPRRGLTKVLVMNQKQELDTAYQVLAKDFRQAGIVTEVFLECKKLPPQFKYAESKDIPFVLFFRDEGGYQLKDIRSGAVHDFQDIRNGINFLI